MHKKDIAIRMNAKGKAVAEWTCPHCGYRNTGRWVGSGKYVCRQCKKLTALKLPMQKIY
jgi:DNA-directed RNA polymerase subunit RPC12/RpoP